MIAAAERDLVRRNVARVADEIVRPSLHALNHFPDTALPERLLPALGELGLFDMDLREPGSVFTLSVVLETLAATAGAPAATLLAHLVARELVRSAGGAHSEGILAARKPLSLFAYPLYAEPGAADSLACLHRVDGDLVLDGSVELVVNAPVSSLLVVPVMDAIAGGAALVAIERNVRGVHVGEPLLTLGMRGSPTADVRFDDVRVSNDWLLAGPPGAAALLGDTARTFRGPAAAISAAILGSSLRRAIEYAKDRYQGGCAIIEHQEVRAIVARMIEDHAACRDAAERLSLGTSSDSDGLARFVRAKERAAYATCDGVQLLGGNGYMEDYGQELFMRDAKQAQCILGRTDIGRQELTTALLAEGGPDAVTATSPAGTRP